MASRLWGLLALGAATLASCLIYNEDLLVDGSGAAGAGASTSVGGGGGTAMQCTAPGDCPGDDTTCATRACTMGACGFDFAVSGAACTEGGGKLCDGFGNCVECLTESDCTGGQICNAHACVDPMSLPLGAPCDMDQACMSNQCADGVCCDSACLGFCMGCNLAGMAGTCALAPDGADPHQDCSPDACNGAGACRCGDGAKNGDESAIDCGGDCTGCALGQACNGNGDCLSNNCVALTCAALCGDMTTEGGEDCDDGNTDDFDGCSPTCKNPTSHLVISEIVTAPNGAEMVEIYNPTSSTVSLSAVWIADYDTYYLVTQGGTPPQPTDFLARFPSGASIGPGAFRVVSLESATAYQAVYGALPDFDLDGADPGAPAMLGSYTSSSGLTNGDEMVVLFQWSAGNLVTDLDYLTYGNTSSGMNKSGVNVNGSVYASETPLTLQVSASAPGIGKSIHRCDTAETSETKTGGNGSGSHDETSEDGTVAFKYNSGVNPSPKAAPPAGFCP
ncbi:MAG: lamin tail domain-containing protein [Polyangiaceae bacterium]